MNETYAAVREIMQKARAKQARRVVSDQLVSYHVALLRRLERENAPFVRRIVERVQTDMDLRNDAAPARAH